MRQPSYGVRQHGEVALAELIAILAPPLCWGCAGATAPGDPLCRSCRLALGWLPPASVAAGSVVTWAPLAYEGPARALVRALKFRGAEAVVETMAAQIVAWAPPRLLAGAALVPVPLHASRRRSRGFNQAELLANALIRRTGLPLADCLERRGPPAAQAGRRRPQRLVAAAGSVTLRSGATVPPRALLVDDVITTGATLTACAAALRAGGVNSVQALGYARTLGR